jgi:hypothetical protein
MNEQNANAFHGGITKGGTIRPFVRRSRWWVCSVSLSVLIVLTPYNMNNVKDRNGNNHLKVQHKKAKYSAHFWPFECHIIHSPTFTTLSKWNLNLSGHFQHLAWQDAASQGLTWGLYLQHLITSVVWIALYFVNGGYVNRERRTRTPAYEKSDEDIRQYFFSSLRQNSYS